MHSFSRQFVTVFVRISSPKFIVPVDPEDGLYVMGWIPAGVEDDDSVSGDEVDAQAAGFG